MNQRVVIPRLHAIFGGTGFSPCTVGPPTSQRIRPIGGGGVLFWGPLSTPWLNASFRLRWVFRALFFEVLMV